MAKKTPPRKMKNIKNALSAALASSVEVDSSNCSEAETLQEVNNHAMFGYGKAGQTYTQGQVVDFASEADQALQVTGKGANGQTQSIKNANNLIGNSISAGLSTTGNNYYFNTTQTVGKIPSGGVTGSSIVNFAYSKNGPQAGYIPQLVHGSGLGTGQEFVFFLPSKITGSGGSNMPSAHSRSFEVTIAGAVAPGESVQVYTASVAGARVATGSAFIYSASFCSTPNYIHQSVRIPTASLAGGNPLTSNAGIVVVYSASYAIDGTKENTPYAGLVVSINPSAQV